MRIGLWGLTLCLSGCMGVITPGEGEPVAPTPLPPVTGPSTAALATPEALGPSTLQRLTQRQLVRGVETVFGVKPDALTESLAPFDSPSATYFDNDAEALSISLQLITDYEAFAWSYAGQVRQAGVLAVGCTPATASDEVCFRSYLSKVGRRAFRRPLTASEQDALVARFLPVAAAENDFFVAVELVVATWLQHPEVLYRVEAGAPMPGAPTPLNAWEVGSRLSFLVTGLPPDDELLDAAARGALDTEQGRATQVTRLLSTSSGIAHGQYLHAKWLGYADRYFPDAIAVDARRESDALVEQLVTDLQRDWLSLFTADQTFLTPALAQHYGLPSPGANAGWVKLPPNRAGGFLSQASYAALGAKFGDTSPTLRGYETLKRALCGHLSGDIPDGVDVTMPPGNPTACKPDRYTMRTTVGCEHCHRVMDPIGLGMEQLGPYGEWREGEPNNATCSTAIVGQVDGRSFMGPAQLGRVLTEDPRVGRCASQQLFESMAGRKTQPSDDATLDALYAQYLDTRSYGSLVLSLAKSPSFVLKTAN